MACFKWIYSAVFLLLVVTLVPGCANGRLTAVTEHPALDYEMTGIPILFFGFGTSTPITPNLSLTAAHVAKTNYDKVIAYHPECDLALVESDNSVQSFSSLGLVYPNDKVQTFGMNFTGQVLRGDGAYHRDLMLIESKYFKACPASITDAPVQDGMSGGGVYNEANELVGIIAAVARKGDIRLLNGEQLPIERVSIFVALNFVRDWLDAQVQSYYGAQVYRLTWHDSKAQGQMLADNH